ncbi:hypothetical protein L2K20_29090 [Mycobacterium sp. MBM]|nr:hypothetical protein [Mycobacterium sp. MBM]
MTREQASNLASLLGALLVPHPSDLTSVEGSDIEKNLYDPLYSLGRHVPNGLGGESAMLAADFLRSSFGTADYLLYQAIGAIGAGVTTVGIRGKDQDGVGVGFEDLTTRPATELSDALRREFRGDVEVYETGRISAQNKRWFGRGTATGKPVHDPVVPGCAISAVRSSFGTLGAIVEGPHIGHGFISNAHVLQDSARGRPVWQPREGDPGARPIGQTYQVVAPAKGAINTLDGGVASLSGGTSNTVPAGLKNPFGPLISDVGIGTRVVKVGATTGITRGEITLTDARAAVWYGATVMNFARQYEITSLDGQPFSGPGDSGSVVATEDGLRPFGLLFGGTREKSWASPLDAALVLFGVRLSEG